MEDELVMKICKKIKKIKKHGEKKIQTVQSLENLPVQLENVIELNSFFFSNRFLISF